MLGLNQFLATKNRLQSFLCGAGGRGFAALALGGLIALGSSTSGAAAVVVATTSSAAGPLRVLEVAGGLEHPWGLAFLPDGRMLVTERPGRMRIVNAQGQLSAPLAGVPAVHAQGQGGLLDVVLSPHFEADRTLFFSYAQPTNAGARTAVARAVLDVEEGALREVQVIFVQNEDPPGRHHFGSRLVFAQDGRLFVTTGDRNQRDRAQALDSHIGKVLRIAVDGAVPADNPFANNPQAMPEIWSYGHRNIQGAVLHPQTGVLWTHEHGPQGGDEINLTRAGKNYGWPEVTYGREYGTGFAIGQGSSRDDVEPPLHQWTPSIAPSGMAFHGGGVYPQWAGSLFVGALRGQHLARIELDGERMVGEERLLTDLRVRIRDVREGPDGLLYLLDESRGRILRVEAGGS